MHLTLSVARVKCPISGQASHASYSFQYMLISRLSNRLKMKHDIVMKTKSATCNTKCVDGKYPATIQYLLSTKECMELAE